MDLYSLTTHENNRAHAEKAGTPASDSACLSCLNTIGGGGENIIMPQISFATIAGGYCNSVNGNVSFIGGGLNNSTAGLGAFVGAGGCNVAAGFGSAVVGGGLKEATGSGAFVGAGGDALFSFPVNNSASGDYSFVGNGQYNCSIGKFSFIGNGGGYTSGTPAVNLGNQAIGDYSFIGSGDSNTISAGNLHSSIVGGKGNTINGNCSAVLGGCGNMVNHDWAGVFGCNITSVKDGAFYSNVLYSTNMAAFTTTDPGELQFVVAPAILGLPVGTCLVVVV